MENSNQPIPNTNNKNNINNENLNDIYSDQEVNKINSDNNSNVNNNNLIEKNIEEIEEEEYFDQEPESSQNKDQEYQNKNNQESQNKHNSGKKSSINNDENGKINESSYYNASVISQNNNSNKKIKPKFYKLLSQVITNHFENVLNFLELKDLCYVRRVNHLLLAVTHEYYQKRIKFEINIIIRYQEANKEKTTIFMKNIDSQIPISNNNWLDFNLNSVTQKLKILDRNLISRLKSIKSLGKISDCVYAPFCIIFTQNKSSLNLNSLQSKKEKWKQTANKILNDPNLVIKINDLDLENMNDSDILNAFVFLNLDELDLQIIKKSSTDLSLLIIWCQAVVSYHILIHPYIYRNENSIITYGSDVFEFANKMNDMINRFYKFKRFLHNLNIIKIPLADYVFNLQHSRGIPMKSESSFKNLTDLNIGNILSYLNYIDSCKFMLICKKFHNGFKHSIDLGIFEIFKEIYFVKKQSYDRFYNSIPILFNNNIFSSYFLMLDDILHSQYNEMGLTFIPFLTKEQLSDLKRIKSINEHVVNIAKIFCIICDIKPEKRTNVKGELEYLWLDKVKLLVINNTLLKTMRNINQLNFSELKIKYIHKGLANYSNNAQIESIKKINHGIYQLLLWELFVYEYIQIYNPFDFINQEYINNRYDQDQLDLIKYYIEILNFLKYHLKIKYYFSTSKDSSGNNNINPIFDFQKNVDELKKYLKHFKKENNYDIDKDIMFKCFEQNYEKIANVYFETKNLIPVGAKPALYEKILVEILATKENEVNQLISINNTNSLNYDSNEFKVKDEHQNKNKLINKNLINNNSFLIPVSNYSLYNSNKLFDNTINNVNNNNYSTYNSNNCSSFDNSNIINSKKEICINLIDIPDLLIIKNILFYLDINSLPKFALVCKKTNNCIKTHIFIRLFFLNKEKKLIEEENKEIIKSIENKRNDYFTEYEMPPPSKNHSYSLMNQITTDDLMEIKQCFKKYNQNYEIIIEPLMILLGEKAVSTINPDGSKTVSYYPSVKKILFKSNFIKRIKEIELETIDNSIFKIIENLMEGPNFEEGKVKFLSPCLYHLTCWINGVIEFHRVIRKYSLSYYDYDILDDNEINFCLEMDNIVLLYYRLLRYSTKYCKSFEDAAQKIMIIMNIKDN